MEGKAKRESRSAGKKRPAPARGELKGSSDELSYYFARLQGFAPLEENEEKRLFALLERGKRPDAGKEEREEAERARATLVEANLGLVISIAKGYAGEALPLIDLLQAGERGLLEAIDRFDSTKNVKLSTYAYRGIQNHVRSFVREQYAAANLQGGRYSLYVRALEAERELERLGNAAPTYSEIAERLGESDAKGIEKTLSSPRGLLSMDEPLASGGEATLLHTIASAPSSQDDLRKEERLDALQEAFAGLSERERFVLRESFGLDGRKKRSLKDIGAELSLSGERVRQIKLEALYRLRLAMKGK